jgi:hypothetical protein
MRRRRRRRRFVAPRPGTNLSHLVKSAEVFSGLVDDMRLSRIW